MVRTVIGGLAVLALGYALYLGLLWSQQRSMMFPGAGRGPVPDAPLPARAERVPLDTSFGSVEAVFIAAPDPAAARATVIYFHGNAESVAQNVRHFGAISDDGFNVLLTGYPGYSGNDGNPTRETLMAVARAGHDWLQQNPGVQAEHIIAMGRSVGSGPAAELAAERGLAGLVLLSPFTSVAAFARQFGAPGFLVRDRFDNGARLGEFAGPVLVFHGRRDAVIPYSHGRKLAEGSPSAELVTLDCGHNDCPYFDSAFRQRLVDFTRFALAIDAD